MNCGNALPRISPAKSSATDQLCAQFPMLCRQGCRKWKLNAQVTRASLVRSARLRGHPRHARESRGQSLRPRRFGLEFKVSRGENPAVRQPTVWQKNLLKQVKPANAGHSGQETLPALPKGRGRKSRHNASSKPTGQNPFAIFKGGSQRGRYRSYPEHRDHADMNAPGHPNRLFESRNGSTDLAE